MLNLVLVFLLLNFYDVQAFEVFTYEANWNDSTHLSYASLSHDVDLPKSFILCTSSKEATFNDVGMYSIYGEDSTEWLIVSIRPNYRGVMLTIDWGGRNPLLGRNSKSSA